MRVFGAVSAVLLTFFAGVACAQTYPTKPIRVIVGFPAGSIVDIGTRALGLHTQKQLGQPFISEVRTGAGSAIAARAVVNASPDGYTLHFGLLSGLIPALVKNGPIDAPKELAPISDSLTAPYVFYASPKLPVKTLKDLIAYSKTLPADTLNFGATLAAQQMMMQVVKIATGITYTTINYQGSAASIPAILNGEISISFSTVGGYQPFLNAGTIQALFVTASKRMSQFPNIPTASEVGIPNMEAATVNVGFWAPRGTPKEIIDTLNRALVAAVQMPEIVDFFHKQGYETLGTSPEEQLHAYDATNQFWTNAARLTNFQPQ